MHEYRALTDYASAYMRKFRIIAATDRFVQAAIRITQEFAVWSSSSLADYESERLRTRRPILEFHLAR
jgi:hypothetical protein